MLQANQPTNPFPFTTPAKEGFCTIYLEIPRAQPLPTHYFLLNITPIFHNFREKSFITL